MQVGAAAFSLSVVDSTVNYAPTFTHENEESITLDVGSSYSFFISQVEDLNLGDVHYYSADLGGVLGDFVTLTGRQFEIHPTEHIQAGVYAITVVVEDTDSAFTGSA